MAGTGPGCVKTRNDRNIGGYPNPAGMPIVSLRASCESRFSQGALQREFLHRPGRSLPIRILHLNDRFQLPFPITNNYANAEFIIVGQFRSFSNRNISLKRTLKACHHRREWSAAEFPSVRMALLYLFRLPKKQNNA